MGFEAYITDEKWNPLPEYKVEIFGEEKMAMCYIASNRFCIKVKSTTALNKDVEWSYRVHVDGANVGTRLCGLGDYANFDAVTVSRDTSKPLVFGHLDMTDDDNQVGGVENRLDKLGTVQVSFFRFSCSGQLGVVEDSSRSVKAQVIHERSKKAGCHQVVLGDLISHAPRTFVKGTFIDLDSSPQFTFLFHYRSLDVLQAQEIAPRPEVVPPPQEETNADDQSNPPKEPPQGKRPADEGAEPARKKQRVKREDPDMFAQREEVANMKKQLEELQSKIREAEENLGDSDDGIKREASPISVPSFRRGKPIVIDLTID
ncbi:hypothetical protein NLI96_g1757 [Meripilus lineatus]|uniref:DUF7918 domain-containing protein n=1 Tax=Meripilus lineatus TaxID=2056292 RepID=A0AAD5V9U7_9APHY|nr:hypothetical protein NLI96_g1757 [Physisporinus lineatus]